MKNYILEDGFEFVTNNMGLVVRTRSSRHGNYQEEVGLVIYVMGSVSTHKIIDLSDRTNISNPPIVGEHIIVDNELVGRSASPARITSIKDNSSSHNLVRRVADYILRR